MTTSWEVGQWLPTLEKGPITQVDLVKYAGASGDYNPIHTVEAFAKEKGLGGVIAHGMLTMGYVGQMLTDFAWPLFDLTDYSVRFRAMVRPGDTILCKGKITRVAKDGDMTVATVQVFAENLSGETVVKGTATLRLA